MATYTIPKITPSVFNSSDYIDTSYLTKKEADDLYINEIPESIEKLIGNINIIGEETVSSQVVTGNCVVNGSLTANTINGGVALDQGKKSEIKGNVVLGDTGWGTQVTLNGQVQVGTNTRDVKIKGGTTEINKDAESGHITIGNGVNTLTVNGALSVNSGSNNISMSGSTIGLNSTGTSATTCNIGQTNNTTNLLGTVTIGSSTKETSINASNISLAGSTIGLNSLGTAVTTCNIGKENNNTTNIPGVVNIGSNTKDTSISGSNVNINTSASSGVTTIGNGTSLIDLNSINVDIGNDNINSVTEIKGRTIAIGNNNTTGGIQIGRGALTADAVGGQANTFVSTVNKIFNPRICDAWGNVTTQNFNLNSPCVAVFSAGTRYVGSSVTLPSTATRTVYLNVPDLTSIMTYPIILDFSHFVFGGFPTTLSPVSTVLVGYDTATSTAMASSEARSKSLACNMVLCVAKATSSSAHKYYFLPNINTTTNPFKSTSIKLKVNNTATTYNYTPFTVSKVSETKLRIDVQFPQSSTSWSVTGANDTSASNEFVYSLGFTIRLQTSPASNSSIGLFPNNSTDSPAGSCWLSLS
jgi:hypothetical protein